MVAIIAINLTPLVKNEASVRTTEEYAEACNMTEEEFILISSVTEAESNRSTDGNLDGRIYIAATILNRVESDYFPNTIYEVLTQRNQFSTVRNGQSITNRTEYSDEAVYQAYQLLQEDKIPHNILFFNCRGFNYGTPFRLYENQNTIGGNYFMTYGD